ncbi:DUF2147 domain-containing protein [Labilibacter sediminis]|nr:DUF2147 domain-containing protein [Labilibacter sediminis]
MTIKNLILSLIILLSALSLSANDKVVGVWLTQDADSKVEITQGKDGLFYGTIIWLKEPLENGKPRIDKNNPDEDLQSRKIMGLKLLEGFKYNDGDEEWTGGSIYDPKSGNTYKCYMWFDGDEHTLNVKGYIGFSLMGRKVEWTRIQ